MEQHYTIFLTNVTIDSRPYKFVSLAKKLEKEIKRPMLMRVEK